jgi:hypothetical protein
MTKPVYVFKVALAGDKDIWRRIAVRADQTLEDLHDAIFEAFDRYDEHLYSFYVPEPGSRGRARSRSAIEYTAPEAWEEEGLDPCDDDPIRDAGAAEIGKMGLKRNQKFQYLFDFGDEWWHDITVEDLNAPAEPGDYPRILERNGKSPPQYSNPDENEEYGEGADDDGDEED